MGTMEAVPKNKKSNAILENRKIARLESLAYYLVMISFQFPDSRHFPVSGAFGTASMVPETTPPPTSLIVESQVI
jgi:hypothetical protein